MKRLTLIIFILASLTATSQIIKVRPSQFSDATVDAYKAKLGYQTPAEADAKYSLKEDVPTKEEADSLYVSKEDGISANAYIHAVIDSLIAGTYQKGDSTYKMTYTATSRWVLEALTFTNKSSADFIESPAATWGNGYAVATKSLAGDGWVECEVAETADSKWNIGLSLTNTVAEAWWDYTLYSNGTNYRACNTSGTGGSGGTPTIGDIVRLKRTGTTITAEYYRGGAWNLIYTFEVPTSATLYIKVATSYSGRVYKPKGYHVN